MIRPFLFVALACATMLAASVRADDIEAAPRSRPTKQVDADEILRRGDMVVRTADGHRSDGGELFAEAFRMPPDDSGKWFVLLFTSPSCAPCAQLKNDWRTSPELLAFARPGDQANSWAHYQEIDTNDRTQKWRNYRIASVPTVVIQPPLNQQFGPPSTIVFQQSGYDGNPSKLAAAMRSAITKFLQKQQGIGASGNYPPPNFPNQPAPSPFFQNPTPPLQIPPGPLPATLDALKAACPGADAEFLLGQVAQQATVEQAQAAWKIETMRREMEKLKDAKPSEGSPIKNLHLLWMVPVGLLGGGSFLVCLTLLLLTTFRAIRKWLGLRPLLNDDQFAQLTDLVKSAKSGRS